MGADFGLRPGRVPVAGKATQRAALTVSIMLTQQVHKVDPVKKLAEAKDEATREVLQKLIAAEEAKPPPTPKCPVGVSLAKRCRLASGWFDLSVGGHCLINLMRKTAQMQRQSIEQLVYCRVCG